MLLTEKSRSNVDFKNQDLKKISMSEDMLYIKAFRMALKVDFLKEKGEVESYTWALYESMKWGESVK